MYGCSWGKSHQAVSEVGSWVDALLIPGSNKMHVGQTKARGLSYSVFDRGKEHIIRARDWALLQLGKRAAVPL